MGGLSDDSLGLVGRWWSVSRSDGRTVGRSDGRSVGRTHSPGKFHIQFQELRTRCPPRRCYITSVKSLAFVGDSGAHDTIADCQA
jgi:hypothetical protein